MDKRLDSEAVLYRSCAGRAGWRHVLLAFVCTVVLLALLPFADLLTGDPVKQLELRRVDAIRVPVPPQPLRFADVPPPLPPPPSRQDVSTPDPKLEMPAAAREQRLSLSPALELVPDLVGEIPVRFEPAAGLVAAAPVAAPAAVPDSELLELADLDRPPMPVLQIRPLYPYQARARQLEGFVELEFTVTTEGNVTNVQVIASAPGPVFVEAARRAVTRWRFEPGVKAGRPAQVRMQVKLRFELR